MPRPSSVETLRLRLRAVIAYRDAYGLSDVVADTLNGLECAIAHEERRQERRAARRSWWPFFGLATSSREFAA